MISGKQMNRLLQGDVGSGKTMVAFMSMLLAVDNGFQACIMAPTEILARQHYASMQRFAEGLNVKVAILTGASKAKERRASLEGIASGEVDILIGTHALIEEGVQFSNLGYVVISGGENLYPVQIEDFLRGFSKIKDVAVIGMPDARLGEIAVAIVEIKEDETCTQAEIEEFCTAMPRYKRPKKIFFDKVPRNPTGKIEKPALREKYCGKRLVEAQITG
jgi:hypothetical protein